MGYTTGFTGALTITPSPSDELVEFVNAFSSSRRMKRDAIKKYGVDGEFYTHKDEILVTNHNAPPNTQPSLWCQWIIENGKLVWDGVEKFYNYTDWLCYMIGNFFGPHNFKLNGVLVWQGDQEDDIGSISVVDNVVYVYEGNTEGIKSIDDATIAKNLLVSDNKIEIFHPIIKNPLDFKSLLIKD